MPEFVKMLNEFKTDQVVDAVVLRKGKKESIKGLKLPEAPKGGFPGFPGGFPGGFPKGFPELPKGFPELPKLEPFFPGPQGGQVKMSTVHTADGGFTTRFQNGKQNITVTGQIDEGKAKVASIEIREGTNADTYKAVDQVPENLRETVRNLIRLNESSGPGKSKIKQKTD